MDFERFLTTTKKSAGKNTRKYIVLHHTGSVNYEAMCNLLSGGQSGRMVSVHYIVSQKGEIAKVEDHMAILWHAGESRWNGITDLNRHSIGIEICSDGHNYTDKQRQAVDRLVRFIMESENVPHGNILRHADISGFRGKWDVGQNFYGGNWTEYQNRFAPQEPSQWAQEAWNKAIAKGVLTKDPHGEVISRDLEVVFHRLNLLNSIEGSLSRERLAIVLDRLDLL